MSQFISNLQSLNRKERYWLLKWAVGSDFKLTQSFREAISEEIGVSIPEDSWVAMDYHLNWIYAALVLNSAEQGRIDAAVGKVFPNPCAVPGDKLTQIVRGNQEDIDLVIAFEDKGVNHLVMVEAKALSPWLTKQIRSKVTRLASIFSDELLENVRPHFVVVSPKAIGGSAISEEWPLWMKDGDSQVRWAPLEVRGPLYKVVRCDKDAQESAASDWWTLRPVSGSFLVE